MEFWCGVAVGRGVKVTSHEGSTFKLSQITYTDTPYALDPTWLPHRDATSETSTWSRNARRLRETVKTGKLVQSYD
jgi:hypothetical protein